MEKGETMINYNKLSETLKTSFNKTFSQMTIEELKKLDWFTYETDFFIEKDKKKEAA